MCVPVSDFVLPRAAFVPSMRIYVNARIVRAILSMEWVGDICYLLPLALLTLPSLVAFRIPSQSWPTRFP